MSYFNSFAKGQKQSHHRSFDLGEIPGYQPPRDFNADILDTLGRGSTVGRGIHKQWEEYYDQPGKRAESGSFTKAYATDEGKRITHQLWQEAMGNNYQNVSALLDNQSMVSASQVAEGPFQHHLEMNLAGFTQLGEYHPWSVMSDPLGVYMEIGEVNEEKASGIRVGLLTYNDPSKTYSTYLGSNFNEAYQRKFGRPPGQAPGIMSDPQAYPDQPTQKARMVEKGQEEESTLNTPQLKIPCLEPKAPPRPLLPGAELKMILQHIIMNIQSKC